MQRLADVSLTDARLRENPYPVYAELLAKGGVSWSDRHNAWLVGRYEYVRALLADSRMSVNKIVPFAEQTLDDLRPKIDAMQVVMQHWVVFTDPPAHSRLRKILQRGFTPRTMGPLEAAVREVATELLDALGDRTEVEFMGEFARQLPAIMMCDLFGVPRADGTLMQRWATDVGKFVLGFPDPDAEDKYDVTMHSLQEMVRYFEQLVDVRSSAATPTQPPRDLLDALIASQLESNGLTKDEIAASLVLIIFAGLETTANMLGDAVHTLSSEKAGLERLRIDPTKIGHGLEELLRFDGPAPLVTRVAAQDMHLGDVKIKRGDRLLLLLHAANRDHAAFEAADTVDFARDGCPHVTFGYSTHFCLGAPLARLEGRVALEEMLRRYVDFDVVGGEIEWRKELLARGPKTMRLRLTPAA